jgi:hypothetical protein
MARHRGWVAAAMRCEAAEGGDDAEAGAVVGAAGATTVEADDCTTGSWSSSTSPSQRVVIAVSSPGECGPCAEQHRP